MKFHVNLVHLLIRLLVLIFHSIPEYAMCQLVMNGILPLMTWQERKPMEIRRLTAALGLLDLIQRTSLSSFLLQAMAHSG